MAKIEIELTPVELMELERWMDSVHLSRSQRFASDITRNRPVEKLLRAAMAARRTAVANLSHSRGPTIAPAEGRWRDV